MNKLKQFLTGVALVATLTTGVLGNQDNQTTENVAAGNNGGTVTIQYEPGTTG